MHQYLKCLNAHDIDGFKAIWNPLGVFNSAMGETPVAIAFEETLKVFKCFPDVTFYATGIECIFSDQRKGIFRIKKIGLEGTHTGEAFGVGPYKPVKASGVKIAPDPDFMILTIIDGLIQEIQLTPHGPCSGLECLYEQVGGRTRSSGKRVFARKSLSRHPASKWRRATPCLH